jgi:hypothetical protein
MKNSQQLVWFAVIAAGVIGLIVLLPLLIYSLGWFLA